MVSMKLPIIDSFLDLQNHVPFLDFAKYVHVPFFHSVASADEL